MPIWPRRAFILLAIGRAVNKRRCQQAGGDQGGDLADLPAVGEARPTLCVGSAPYVGQQALRRRARQRVEADRGAIDLGCRPAQVAGYRKIYQIWLFYPRPKLEATEHNTLSRSCSFQRSLILS